jgi:hypothetical protein
MLKGWSNILTVACITLAGIVEAGQQALKDAPKVAALAPESIRGDFWNYVALLFLVAAGVLWITGRLAPSKAAHKAIEGAGLPHRLVIHSAVYGTGAFDEVSVAHRLNAATRDALVIPVDNNLVDRDPAPMKPKRLLVEYSYGGPSLLRVSRAEGGRLVLPEDSEIQRLAAEVQVAKHELAITALTARETPIGDPKPLGSLPVYRQELEVQLLSVIVGTAIAVNTTLFTQLKLWARIDLNIVKASVRVKTYDEIYETTLLSDLSEWLLVEEVIDRHNRKNHRDTSLEASSLVKEIESGIFHEGHHQPKWIGCELPLHFLKREQIKSITIVFYDKHGVVKKETYREWPMTMDRIIDADFRQP